MDESNFTYLNLCVCPRMKKVLISQAEAEKIRKIGEAEACSIEAVGKAEAEKMRLKAEAYQQYGEAAKTALVLEALPKVIHRWSLQVFLKGTVVHNSSCIFLFFNDYCKKDNFITLFTNFGEIGLYVMENLFSGFPLDVLWLLRLNFQ